MLRVTLRYTDCLQDGRNVFGILANHNVEILGTWTFLVYHPRVTIRVKNHNELNNLLCDLNNHCSYEVGVLKVRKERQ